jgi:integrase
VAKILTLGCTVWRYGRRIKLAEGNAIADVKKPRAAKRVPYILDVEEIGRLRAALAIPMERLLVELTITTGMRSGEVRGLTWESIDLDGKRLFVERQASRRGEEAATNTGAWPIPLPAYLIPELKRWKLACPLTERGLVFPGEPDARAREWTNRRRHSLPVLRRALRRPGLTATIPRPAPRQARSMHEAGVPLKRAQEFLGHASERTALAIYTPPCASRSMTRPTRSQSSRASQMWETKWKQLAP